MTRVEFHRFGEIQDECLQFVVTAARYDDRWVFCRHKKRTTWELPGGRREPGESIMQAMRRELWEETGALESQISPVCVYSVTKENKTTYGALFFSEMTRLGVLPEKHEIGQIQLTDILPIEQTYPDIQPKLFSYIQGWLNTQSNPEELWDVYDAYRNKTGELHRRGDPLKEGQFHLVVHVWILGSDGRFLLTKRSTNKGFPNMWESTGGSALAGDDSLTAAIREVKEETGLLLDPKNGKRIMTMRRQDYFRDVWLFHQDFDLADVVLQPGETVDKMYADKSDILRLLENGSFVPYDYIPELLEAASIAIDNME